MLSDVQPQFPSWTEDAPDEGLLPFAYQRLDQRFRALLEDEEAEEVFGEFRVDLGWPE